MKERGEEGGEFSTIFFGGGTPTLLEPKHFDKIIKNINSSFVIRNSELTIEANPGTADQAKLKALRSLGINRLSIGVQSFNDRHLQTLGRIHDAETAKRFYHDARDAGFDNINLDLIFALPGQTLDEWKQDLETALTLTTEPPNHLSTYNLQIEEGTPFWERAKKPSSADVKVAPFSQREKGPHSKGKAITPLPLGEGGQVKRQRGEGFSLPSEDEELAMYEYAIEELTAHGYKHYEISNFAKPGYECQHNLTYWRNENYIGIGAGAHSHVNGRRWSNPNCVEEYVHNARRTTPDETHFAPDQRETIFLGLRLLDGLAKEHFAGFEREVSELMADGLLRETNTNYKLTRKGLYLGNLVFAKFV